MTRHTLLLRLAGPQQAWGAASRFNYRDTELVPTKSGVIGLLAAALGLDRRDQLAGFADLEFGVRVDRAGKVERDFQTAIDQDGKSLPLSHRYYLADAIFTVGLSADELERLETFRQALRRPVYPLYLGRRAFPPAGPIKTSLVHKPLREALAIVEDTPKFKEVAGPKQTVYEIHVDAQPGDSRDHSIDDVPISFDPRRRRYGRRDVHVYQVGESAHDPMELVAVEEVTHVSFPNSAEPS